MSFPLSITGVYNNYLILENSQNLFYHTIFEWYYFYNEIIGEKLWNIIDNEILKAHTVARS